jgi:hypothetical protein
MAEMNMAEKIEFLVEPLNQAGNVMPVEAGSVTYNVSDPTIISMDVADPTNDLTGYVKPVSPAVDAGGNPIPARFTITADADPGTGVMTLTGISEDITVVLDPNAPATTFRITLSPPVPQT